MSPLGNTDLTDVALGVAVVVLIELSLLVLRRIRARRARR